MSTTILIPCQIESLKSLMKAPRFLDNILSSSIKGFIQTSSETSLAEFLAEVSNVVEYASYIVAPCKLRANHGFHVPDFTLGSHELSGSGSQGS